MVLAEHAALGMPHLLSFVFVILCLIYEVSHFGGSNRCFSITQVGRFWLWCTGHVICRLLVGMTNPVAELSGPVYMI